MKMINKSCLKTPFATTYKLFKDYYFYFKKFTKPLTNRQFFIELSIFTATFLL